MSDPSRPDHDAEGRDTAGHVDDTSRAFETFFRTQYAAIHDFVARYVIAPEIAADVTQDVFLDAWARWDAQIAAMPARERMLYLYTAARNRAMNVLAHTRVAQRHAARAAAADEIDLPAWHPEGLDAEAIARITRRTIERMPERMRLVYTLNRRDGLTYLEIAQLLGVSVNTVKTQMGRALELLRDALGPFLTMVILLGVR